jgi:hypothetical protein
MEKKPAAANPIDLELDALTRFKLAFQDHAPANQLLAPDKYEVLLALDRYERTLRHAFDNHHAMVGSMQRVHEMIRSPPETAAPPPSPSASMAKVKDGGCVLL